MSTRLTFWTKPFAYQRIVFANWGLKACKMESSITAIAADKLTTAATGRTDFGIITLLLVSRVSHTKVRICMVNGHKLRTHTECALVGNSKVLEGYGAYLLNLIESTMRSWAYISIGRLCDTSGGSISLLQWTIWPLSCFSLAVRHLEGGNYDKI